MVYDVVYCLLGCIWLVYRDVFKDDAQGGISGIVYRVVSMDGLNEVIRKGV